MYWTVVEVCKKAEPTEELLEGLNKLFEEPCASQYHGKLESINDLVAFLADLPYDYKEVASVDYWHPGSVWGQLDREELEYYLPVVHTIMKTIGIKNIFYSSYIDV